MRLGLVLAEIGEKNNIKVTDEELTRAVVERARQFPGQEQQVWDYYRKNPQALASAARADLRGEGGRLPGRARQGDRKKVSREELFKDDGRATKPSEGKSNALRGGELRSCSARRTTESTALEAALSGLPT